MFVSMAYTILQHPLMVEVVLPFLLVFTVMFAVLQKTEILGKGKRQIDAIVAMVVGLIVVAFGYAVHIISLLVPFLAVSLIIILVFMILFGSMFKPGEFGMPKGLMVGIGILIGIAVVSAVIWATGLWVYIYDLILGPDNNAILTNVIIILIFAGAIAAVIGFSGKGSSGK